MPLNNQVQLITYADSLGGDLPALHRALDKHFRDVVCGGVHILPPFPSSADRGFAPLTYFEIDPAFGTWADMRALAADYPVTLDLMVNHISRKSAYFQDFVRRGRNSPWADLFIRVEKVWPDGNPPPADVAKIFLRKPDNPFSRVVIEDTGQVETVWTSFGTRDWSEQVDLDVNAPLTRRLFGDILDHMRRNGIRMLRLDAIGYVIKKPGSSCFFVEPEIYEFMDWMEAQAAERGLALLPEVHAHYAIQFKLAEHGYWVYDFVLPLLILHALLRGQSGVLADYLRVCPRKQFTTLDCHDGIPVQPDLDDILEIDEAQRVVDICLARGANLNRILSGEHLRRAGFDAHQINCTYYSALDCSDNAYLTARALQFFAPGIPQVYYVGLLAGRNDPAEVQRSGEGRAINRHNYTPAEIDAAVEQPVVQRLLRLIRFRNTHPAFQGALEGIEADGSALTLTWRNGQSWAALHADLSSGKALIRCFDERGGETQLEL